MPPWAGSIINTWAFFDPPAPFLVSNELTITIIISQIILPYDAPFFTTWFCTNWEVLYFPVYFVCWAARNKCAAPSEIIAESIRGFRDKGFTGGRFLIRCSLFCGLWVITNYLYILSLRILLATDVMALFATNVSCVYLLSWVILHEQFVGVRVRNFKKRPFDFHFENSFDSTLIELANIKYKYLNKYRWIIKYKNYVCMKNFFYKNTNNEDIKINNKDTTN